MPPLTQNDITINTVTNVASSRRLRQLSTSGVNIGYSVVFNLASTGYSNVDAAWTSFSTSLNQSVSSGDFNTLLTSYSVTYGATDLTGVTSDSVAVGEPSEVDDDDEEDNDDNSNNNKSLALGLGLGLGLGGGLCLIVAAYFYFQRRPAAGRAKSEVLSTAHNPNEKLNTGLLHAL